MRVTASADYDSAFKASQRITAGLLLAFVRPNGVATARLGLAIGKRAAKLAVVRNRVKRALREKFRVTKSEFQPVDVVVSARFGIDKLSSSELNAAVDRLFRRIKSSCDTR